MRMHKRLRFATVGAALIAGTAAFAEPSISVMSFVGTGMIADANVRSALSVGGGAELPILGGERSGLAATAGLSYFEADVESVDDLCFFSDCLQSDFDKGSTSSNLTASGGAKYRIPFGPVFSLSAGLSLDLNRVAIDAKHQGQSVENSTKYYIGMGKEIAGIVSMSDRLSLAAALAVRSVDDPFAVYDIFGDYRAINMVVHYRL